MSTSGTPTPGTAVPNEQAERLALANRLSHEIHTPCFWHSPYGLMITEDLVPFVIMGLRTHGDRRAFFVAVAIRPKKGPDPESERRSRECR